MQVVPRQLRLAQPQKKQIPQTDDASSVAESLDKATIAELSTATIEKMTCDELARVIQAAGMSYLLNADCELQNSSSDRQRLLSLAQLARRCCRSQGY